ncbi:FkbM family methyltransferase [Rhodobacterales bacterium HKCCE2091]|nr:FkbM family methyltransferase [Rhodobacterales bacterium HKCCE2091]
MTSRFAPPDADTLRPQGAFETAMMRGQALPGGLGYICFRKLKRRIGQRAHAAFEAALAGLGPGDIVVDLGANVGDISARLAATGATLHAFEPDPETFGHLAARLGHLPNVTLHNAAAGGRDGSATLFRPPSWAEEDRRRSASKANSVAAMAEARGFVPSGEVPVVDFARFLNGLPDVAQLVKVDIEGAEWELIEAVMDRAPDRFRAMFVETHERVDRAVLPLVKRMQARFAAEPAPYVNLYWT